MTPEEKEKIKQFMTLEQIIYLRRLVLELEQIYEQLQKFFPEELSRTGKPSGLHFLSAETTYSVLFPLENFIDSLRDDIETLLESPRSVTLDEIKEEE